MVCQPFSSCAQSGRVAILKCVFVAMVSLSLLSSRCSCAAEPWADANLPIRDGLELWLDATHATGNGQLPADGKLNLWRDASGKNRNVQSPDANAEPSLLKIGNVAIVRFDGID